MIKLVEIDGKNIAETMEAVLYSDEAGVEIWIPKSKMNDYPAKDEVGTFIIAEWLAIAKELI